MFNLYLWSVGISLVVYVFLSYMDYRQGIAFTMECLSIFTTCFIPLLNLLMAGAGLLMVLNDYRHVVIFKGKKNDKYI